MKVSLVGSLKGSARLAILCFIFVGLTACNGSSSNGSGEQEEEHGHGSLLVSRASTNTLSLVDEGEFEAFQESLDSSGVELIVSDNGEFAAFVDGSSVKFANDEGLLQASITGEKVVATNGHFSILDGGSSTLIELDALEEDTASPATEPTSDLSMAQEFPALMLDEDKEAVLVFIATSAEVYKGENNQTVANNECTNPSSVSQAHNSVIITCDEGVKLLQFEENNSGELLYTWTPLTLDGGTASDYQWQSTDHIFAGFIPGSTHYALVHIEEDGSTEVILSSGSETLDGNICSAGLESEDEDFLFWLEGGSFVALNNEAELINRITVDLSTSTDCSDYTMAVSEKAALVFDNAMQRVHEIDVDDGSSQYHVHETLDIPVSDVASAVVLSREEDDEHDH